LVSLLIGFKLFVGHGAPSITSCAAWRRAWRHLRYFRFFFDLKQARPGQENGQWRFASDFSDDAPPALVAMQASGKLAGNHSAIRLSLPSLSKAAFGNVGPVVS